jgi:ribosomal protein S18 acetylase RimI-like enzyme
MYIFSHLSKKQELCDQIAEVIFQEWPEYFIKLSGIKSIDELSKLYKDYYTNLEHIPTGFVVTEDDKFVGFICVSLNSVFKDKVPRVWLSSIYVDKEHRKKGVAKTMIDNACNFIKETYKAKDVYIWVDNNVRENFYKKMDFVEVENKLIEGYNFTIYKKQLIKSDPSLFQPVHLIGLLVILFIIFIIKRGFGVIFWILGIFQPTPIIIKVT